jgi:hypothetical protein
VKEKCGDSARDPALWDTKCNSGQGVVARTQRMPTVSEVVIGSLENAVSHAGSENEIGEKRYWDQARMPRAT